MSKENKSKFKFLEIFHQDYSDQPELSIPSHWCVKYIEDGKGFVDYSYHNSSSEAEVWAEENTYGYDPFNLLDSPIKVDNSIKNFFGNPVQTNPITPPVSKGYGETPPITPDQWFDVKTFNFIKESRTENLYDYFPIWFEDLSDIEGVYLGGGCLRNLLGGEDQIADIDLFFNSKEAVKSAEKVMESYFGSEKGDWYEAFRCPAGELITYKSAIDKPDEDKTKEDYASQSKVQFSTRSFYDSPEQLINSFDFVPTCACLYQDTLYTHPDWIKCIKKKILNLNFVSYPVATLGRMIKYSHKGYLVPPNTLLDMFKGINENEFPEGQLQLYVD